MASHGLFTLGGMLARYWHPAYPFLPWALTSALLMAAGCWDYWSHGGPVEWIVVGLSAYEFMSGLLEEPVRAGVIASSRTTHHSSAPRHSVES